MVSRWNSPGQSCRREARSWLLRRLFHICDLTLPLLFVKLLLMLAGLLLQLFELRQRRPGFIPFIGAR
jgi:hypothetical protein